MRWNDKPPSEYEKAVAGEAGRATAGWIRRGKRVLVTCRQGRNRSGWVTGIALIELGVPAKKAIAAIRHVRGDDALDNAGFVEALHKYQKVGPARASKVDTRREG